MDYKNKVVVITGGSSGIGYALAREFAAHGARLCLIGRDQARLEDARKKITDEYPAIVETKSADVSDKNAITDVINEIGQTWGSINVLINSAGMIRCGRFCDQELKSLEQTMHTNYLGAVYTAKAAWPWLKAAGGQLGFVSSVAGYVGLIGYSSYAPSKFALAGLAECLWQEGKDDSIRVSILYPPDTDTPLLRYEHANTLPESRALSKNIKVKTAEFVAKKYFKGLRENRFEVYCDSESYLLRAFKNNLPGLFRYYTNKIIESSRKKNQQ